MLLYGDVNCKTSDISETFNLDNDGSLQIPILSMDRLYQTDPVTFSILLF
jgi:hypothetical protein